MSLGGVPPIGGERIGGLGGADDEARQSAIITVQHMQVKLEDLSYYNHLMSSCAPASNEKEFFQNQIQTALANVGDYLNELNEIKNQLATNSAANVTALNASFPALQAAAIKPNPHEILEFQQATDNLLTSLGA